MSKLTALQQHSSNNCDACGRHYENPIHVTNLSTDPMQTYDACPFCFTKLGDIVDKDELEVTIKKPVEKPDATPKVSSKEKLDTEKEVDCPHYLGYLKKRPKDAPIPDACLTCEKMVQCIL